jgi:hypothetical protein
MFREHRVRTMNGGKFKWRKLNDKIIDFGSLKLNDEKHYFKKY